MNQTQLQTPTSTPTPSQSNNTNSQNVQVLKSSPWTSDDLRQFCTACNKTFDNFFNRRHHCRLCGDIFCHKCSEQKALIPPSSIVLQPKGGKKRKSRNRMAHDVSFERDDDPNRTVTYAQTVVDDETNVVTPSLQPKGPSASTLASPPTPIADNRAPMGPAAAYVEEKEKDDNDVSFSNAKSIATNLDDISFSTVQFQDNANTENNDVDEGYNYEDDVAKSMSGLQPPSTSSPRQGDDYDKNKNEEKGCEERWENMGDPGFGILDDVDIDDDDDLSVSVATSTDLSYGTNNTKKVNEQQPLLQEQQPLPQPKQQSIPQQEQKHEQQQYQGFPKTPQRGKKMRQLSSSSDSSVSLNTQNTAATNTPSTSTILYGKGLEERMKLAREPLRVCVTCHNQLQSIQEQLRNHNSNAMKYNSIDPTNIRRLMNSPLAFTLGHEIRKAAYTLNNLLPMPRRMGMFMDTGIGSGTGGEMGCNTKDTCKGFIGNFGNIDGVRIPARLLERAKGVAVMTCIKTGVGVTGIEFGTGLVISRLSSDNHWSPPCAIGTAGISWGALVGVQLSDHVFLLMTDKAVDMFVNNNDGSFQLGADIGVAAGPLGRSFEADVGAVDGDLAPIYTYSLSKGFYAGISLDGKVIITRHGVNEKFYGTKIDPKSLLSGDVPTPPAAQPLYDALKRCHVYASSSSASRVLASLRRQGNYLTNQTNPYSYSYGDPSFSYEAEEEYNLNSRHFTPY